MYVWLCLKELNDQGFYAQSYADNFLIILYGISLEIPLQLTQTALGVIKRWRNKTK